jgi:hypothetical protein
MKGLEKNLKRFIKSKRFNYDSDKCTDEELRRRRWMRRGKIEGEYRITWIKVDNGYSEIMDASKWSDIEANVTIKGKAEKREWCPSKRKNITVMGEISGVAKYERHGGWGDGARGSWYDQHTNSAWGWDSHKKIREQIRVDIRDEVNDFLKLMGIKNQNKIRIGKITWEK